MASLFNNIRANTIICGALVVSFTLTNAIPLTALDPLPVFNQTAFIYRLEKLVKKLTKLENSKKTNKMLSTLMDIKHEIEATYGISIDLKKSMNEVKLKLNENNLRIDNKNVEIISKILKKKERGYVQRCNLIYDLSYNDDIYALLAEKQNGEENQDAEELAVPAHLVWGVSCILCGVFLMTIPLPMCKVWGERMIQTGVVVCGNCIANKVEEDRKKEKK